MLCSPGLFLSIVCLIYVTIHAFKKKMYSMYSNPQLSTEQYSSVHIQFLFSDGSGRSGTFCAVYSLLERVKSEQVVDVFQAIRVLRLGRPEAVETLVG